MLVRTLKHAHTYTYFRLCVVGIKYVGIEHIQNTFRILHLYVIIIIIIITKTALFHIHRHAFVYTWIIPYKLRYLVPENK